MKLELSSINFNNSTIEEREQMTFTEEQIVKMLHVIKEEPSVSGCVILSTCNRTEIYISRNEMPSALSAGEILIKAAAKDGSSIKFDNYEGNDVAYYLTELAGGLKSQILGEGQIVTQIGAAWSLAYNEKTTDSVLNVLFQTAVSAGKKVLTDVKISSVPLSSAYAAFELIKNHFTSLKGKKAMIIGNGNMGRLMQQLLYANGCNVIVTIRGYAHGNNTVVEGCKKIAYADRYNHMSGCDVLVSATRSPHRTIRPEKLVNIEKIPELMVDLAMPRDIDSAVAGMTKLKNINELGLNTRVDEETLAKVYQIINEKVDAFYHWYSYKNALEEIELLKKAMKERIAANLKHENICFEKDSEVVDIAVEKSVRMLIGGMHEYLDVDKIRNCRKKIEKRSRP